MDVERVRQAHVDILMMGGLVMAAGAVDGIPPWARRAVAVGAWTNPLLFLPMAFGPRAGSTTLFKLASLASFTVTCAGWIGVARAARRSARSHRST